MLVMLADRLDDVALAGLTALGCTVSEQPGLTGHALAEALAETDPDVLVVRSTRVDAEHVAAGRSLGLIIRAGAGVNTIDLDACSDRGVFVANCPGKNAVAVAELVFALILSLDRNVPWAAADTAAGRWQKKLWTDGAAGLSGRTLAVLGVGQVGAEVLLRAQAFGLRTVAWSRSLTPERATALGTALCATPLEAVRNADIVSVHVAAAPQTKGLVSGELLAAMRPTAMLINTSRADVVDESALAEAVRERGLRAGLDVLSAEPRGDGDVEHPLLALPGVVVTPHIGASTTQASQAVAAEVVRIVARWRERGRVPNVVNKANTGASAVLVVRHLDRVGVLANVLARLSAAGVNVEDMENVILAGGRGAVARIGCSGEFTDELLTRIESLEHVLRATRTAT